VRETAKDLGHRSDDGREKEEHKSSRAELLKLCCAWHPPADLAKMQGGFTKSGAGPELLHF